MQTPVTQEEIDKRTNMDNRIRYIGDLMQQLNDIEDPLIKLKIHKALLSDVINDPEVMGYIQTYIDDLEAKTDKNAPTAPAETEEAAEESDTEALPDIPSDFGESQELEDKEVLLEAGSEDDKLPTPEELEYDALNDRKIKVD